MGGITEIYIVYNFNSTAKNSNHDSNLRFRNRYIDGNEMNN